ncbi:MAG: PqqD family protein [Phocaeicola sp.]|uniref:PqqD family protein n=1 Tax=Phocaeicola sp. TaxID=2773926 RepID=UPI003FA143B6
MKRQGEFIKRKVADEVLLVPIGKTAQTFNGMITLSDVGEFIWDHIEETQSFQDFVDKILEVYDIDGVTAAKDASTFLMQLLRAGMLRQSSENW